MRRSLLWLREYMPGAELCFADLGPDRLEARGTTVLATPTPCQIDYELETADGFITKDLSVRARGDGWSRDLRLRRATDGTWTATASSEGAAHLGPAGGDTSTFAGALDCDLVASLLTNTMPIRRHGLLDAGGPVDLVMAWVSAPDLAVRASRQRYTFVGRRDATRIVRYESGSFRSDLEVDEDGFVVRYPGLGWRVEEEAARQ